MPEPNQGVLMYTCPDTGRGVTTGISTNESALTRLGQLQLSVWCPYCETPHAIRHKEAMLVHLQVATSGDLCFVWEGTAESLKATLDRAGAKIEVRPSPKEGRAPADRL